MPFLGHHPYDGLDVSPDKTPPVLMTHGSPDDRARDTVRRFALDTDDESMLLDLLGLRETDTA